MNYQNEKEINETMSKILDESLEWDAVLTEDPVEWKPLDPGTYAFKVNSFARKRYIPGPNSKLSECDIAELELTVFADGREVKIKHDLFMHSKFKYRLSAFFIAIGQKKPGENCRMDWQKVPGSVGVCEVGIREYTRRDQTKGVSNEVTRFLPPDEKVSVAEKDTF